MKTLVFMQLWATQLVQKKILQKYVVHFKILKFITPHYISQDCAKIYFRASQYTIITIVLLLYILASHIGLTPPWKQFFPLYVAPDELNQETGPSHLFSSS